MVGVNRDLGDVPEAEHRAIWAENITNVEAEAIEPLLALVRAAGEFFEPVASPHPKYRQPAQDGHRPGSWPSDECERCRDQHAAKVHALRDAVSALDPAIVAAARKP